MKRNRTMVGSGALLGALVLAVAPAAVAGDEGIPSGASPLERPAGVVTVVAERVTSERAARRCEERATWIVPYTDLEQSLLSPWGTDWLSAPLMPVDAPSYETTARAVGFIATADGLVVTAEEVTAGADRLMVRLADGRRFPARVVSIERDAGAALLRIDGAAELPTLPLGASETLVTGEPLTLLDVGCARTAQLSGRLGRGGHEILLAWSDAARSEEACDDACGGGLLLDANGTVVAMAARPMTVHVAPFTPVALGGLVHAVPVARIRGLIEDAVGATSATAD